MKAIFDIKIENGNNKISIMDIDGPAMTEVLRYIYTQEVENIKILAPKLLHGAHKYAIYDLMKLCATAMIKNLTVENALEYFILADKYKLKALLARSATFMKL